MRKSVSLEDVIAALRDLGGEAQSTEIKDRVEKNFGGVPDNYRNVTSFRETIQVIIQKHCPEEKKYEKKPVFKKIATGRFRLINNHPASPSKITTKTAVRALSAEDQRFNAIKVAVERELESFSFEEEHFEGQQRERHSNYYERDSRLRAKAIALHGTTCFACGFDFQKKYGDYGKDFIEVHHKKPICELGGNTKIDPQTDMAVLCANCHRIIHRKRERVLSVDELKEIIILD